MAAPEVIIVMTSVGHMHALERGWSPVLFGQYAACQLQTVETLAGRLARVPDLNALVLFSVVLRHPQAGFLRSVVPLVSDCLLVQPSVRTPRLRRRVGRCGLQRPRAPLS